MLSVAEKTYTLLVLSSPIDTTPLEPLGYETSQVNNPQAAQHCLEETRIDAILAGDDAETLQFIARLARKHRDNPQRPVICVVSTQDDLLADADHIDIILPPIPLQFIERQLRRHLEFRQRRVNIELEQSEITLLKNAIVRNVSHELKTPLLQVKSAVALIAEDDVDEKLSRMAVLATARLETVVKNITLLADSMNGTFGPVLVHESLDQAIRNLRRIWVHKNAISRIERHFEGNIPPVMGDQQGLGVVLQQLLDNALKFSKDTVRVEVKTSDGYVHIAVIDRGIGIEPDKIKTIFESFYQIDPSPTRRYGGTGVGLAIVRIIMEKHNVNINVTSTPGEGSIFAFSLPAATLHDS